MSQLRVLSLAKTNVTDAGLIHLRGLSQLVGLDLSQTKVTNTGLVHLEGLKHLDSLGLADTQVTDAGLTHLWGFTVTLRTWPPWHESDGSRRQEPPGNAAKILRDLPLTWPLPVALSSGATSHNCGEEAADPAKIAANAG